MAAQSMQIIFKQFPEYINKNSIFVIFDNASAHTPKTWDDDALIEPSQRDTAPML